MTVAASALDGGEDTRASCGMTEPARRPNRALLLKLVAAGVVLLVAAVLVARGLDLKGLALHLTNPKAALVWMSLVSLGLPTGAPASLISVYVAGCFLIGMLSLNGFALMFWEFTDSLGEITERPLHAEQLIKRDALQLQLGFQEWRHRIR